MVTASLLDLGAEESQVCQLLGNVVRGLHILQAHLSQEGQGFALLGHITSLAINHLCQVKHLPCLLQVASLGISLLSISLHLVTNLLTLHDLILLLSLLLSVVTGVGFGHNVMLLKVLFKSISNLLLDLRLLISGHCLSVLPSM